MSSEAMNDAARRASVQHSEVVESLLGAFMLQHGCMPDECEVVSECRDLTYVTQIRKREVRRGHRNNP